MKSKVLLCASSSGGHINPARAIGKGLQERGHQIKYLGIKGEIEEKLIDKEELITLEIGKSFKKFTTDYKHYLKNISELKRLKKIISNYDVIIGFGGFITFFTSLVVGQKIFILHEQNVPLGDSLKYSLRAANELVFSFDSSSLKRIPKKLNVSYLGNPSYALIENKTISKNSKSILFVSGSLGSNTMLKLALKCAKMLPQYQITVISGNRHYEDALHLKESSNVTIIPYGNMKELFPKHELIVMRAGGSSLVEALSFNRMMLLIPSPYVKNNHQRKNAMYFKENNAAEVIDEVGLDETILKEKIESLFDDKNRQQEMLLAQKKMFKNHALEDFLDLIEKYDS